MKEINDLNALNEVIRSGVTVLKFGADWCKDCRAIDPFMPEVAENYKDQLTLVSVDSEKAPDLVTKYTIMGIPSFIAIKDGQEIARFVNGSAKSRQEIEDFLDKSVAIANELS